MTGTTPAEGDEIEIGRDAYRLNSIDQTSDELRAEGTHLKTGEDVTIAVINGDAYVAPPDADIEQLPNVMDVADHAVEHADTHEADRSEELVAAAQDALNIDLTARGEYQAVESARYRLRERADA